MIDFTNLPLTMTLVIFFGGALVIAVVGSRMTYFADKLADVTGLGEAVFGAAILGASTSLPGIIASMTAAWHGHADLAVGNAVGGIAVQTVFLVVADMALRGTNLEHAAASVANMINAALLCALLALALIAAVGPDVSLFHFHPASLILLGLYAFGLVLAKRTRDARNWEPVETSDTVVDNMEDDDGGRPSMPRLWIYFALSGVVVGIAGWLVGVSGIALVRHTGLSETLVGTLFTSVATSLPELVTSIAAVRQGSLTLAVGGIIGGNTFDVLFLAFSDFAYREGSIYHAVGDQPLFIISLTILMTTMLLLGLIRRERHGVGNIGFESAAVFVLYAAGLSVLVIWPGASA